MSDQPGDDLKDTMAARIAQATTLEELREQCLLILQELESGKLDNKEARLLLRSAEQRLNATKRAMRGA